MTHSCLLEIQNRYEELTPNEKLVADYIHENGSQAVHMTVRTLAEQAGVTKSTVLRCCKALGFSSFSELKISLSTDLAQKRQMNFSSYILPEDSTAEILHKVLSANIKALHDTLDQVDPVSIDRLADALAQANMIYIFGFGSSAPLCSDLHLHLLQIGKTAYCATDPYYISLSAQNIGEDDVAIGISHHGQTISVIDGLATAKKRGALTACLTSQPDSLIVKTCDLPIIVSAQEIKYPIDPVSTRIAHTSIMDVITIALSTRDFVKTTEHYQHLSEIVKTTYVK